MDLLKRFRKSIVVRGTHGPLEKTIGVLESQI
jgi:hypothetical protein